MDADLLQLIIPIAGIVAVLFAVYLARDVLSRDTGTKEMEDVAGTIYEGAVATEAWPRIVAEMTAVLDAPKGRLFTPLTPPDKGGLGISRGIPEAALKQWGEKYIQHDPSGE